MKKKILLVFLVCAVTRAYANREKIKDFLKSSILKTFWEEIKK